MGHWSLDCELYNSLIERCARDAKVAGSNLVIPGFNFSVPAVTDVANVCASQNVNETPCAVNL